MNWKSVLLPTKRRMALSGVFAVVGVVLWILTLICWDGFDETGQLVGAFEPAGGWQSFPVVLLLAYVAATAVSLRRKE